MKIDWLQTDNEIINLNYVRYITEENAKNQDYLTRPVDEDIELKYDSYFAFSMNNGDIRTFTFDGTLTGEQLSEALDTIVNGQEKGYLRLVDLREKFNKR